MIDARDTDRNDRAYGADFASMVIGGGRVLARRLCQCARAPVTATSVPGYAEEHLPGQSAATADATPGRRSDCIVRARFLQIALSRSAVSIDYFADSEWTERVPLLVQTALLQSFENSGAIAAIDRESIGLRADFILKIEIRHFEAVYASPNGPPEVWVAVVVRLVNPAGRDIVAHASFERRERAAANDMGRIVAAFDEALGVVMADIVVWTVRNLALTPGRR